MLAKFFAATFLVGGALATNGSIYHSPKAKPFVTIDIQVDRPINTTTYEGIVITDPVRGGDITGCFKGHVVENITSSIEKLLPSVDGGTYTSYEVNLLFENDDGERIATHVVGKVTYANNALHGLGYATLGTDIKGFESINYAFFLAEWQANFNTGKGDLQFFELTSGGRVDGQPILALEPPAKQ